MASKAELQGVVVSDKMQKSVVVSVERGASAIDIAVRDRGHGISPEHMSKLFDSFFSTKPSGMGLGLSICKSIVEAHDGRLTAVSAGQYGAIFRIVLPSIERAVT